jgi:protein TonB
VAPSIRPDYGWLNGMLVGRIRERQEYPSLARLRGVEGKVQVRIVIQKNGELGEASIVRSSGHLVLDEAALKTVRDAFPLPLDKPLDTPQLVRVIPISYTLD